MSETAGQRFALNLEFESFREFVDRFASRLSEEGMFVEAGDTAGTPAVGQPVALEARVSNGFGLLKGSGEVAWSRPGGEGVAGFAVRFHELDEPSRRLLTKVVESFRRDGGEVFDLEAPPAVEAPAPAETGPEAEATPAELISSDLYFEEAVPPIDEAPPASVEAGEPPVDLAKTIATGKTLEDLLAGEPAAEPPVEASFETQLLDKLPEPVPPDGMVEPPAERAGGVEEPAAAATEVALPEGLPDSLADLLTGPAEEEGEVSDIPPAIAEAMRSAPPPAVSGEETIAGSGVAGGARRGRWRLAAIALLGLAAGLAAYQYRGLLRSWLPGGGPEETVAAAPAEEAPGRAGSGLPGRRGAAEPPGAAGAPGPVAPGPGAPAAGAPAAGEASPAPAPPATAAPEAAGSPGIAAAPPPPPESATPAPRAARPSAAGAGAAPAPSLDGPFTRVETITWSESAGETVILLTADGPIRPGKFDVIPIRTGDPRVLVKLAGVERPFPGGAVTVGSSHVRRVRTGLHTVPEGREIHVVVDLVDAAVRVDRVEPQGNRLAVAFARP